VRSRGGPGLNSIRGSTKTCAFEVEIAVPASSAFAFMEAMKRNREERWYYEKALRTYGGRRARRHAHSRPHNRNFVTGALLFLPFWLRLSIFNRLTLADAGEDWEGTSESCCMLHCTRYFRRIDRCSRAQMQCKKMTLCLKQFVH
jgi:hypothetical protein